jgi:hypothetical protein
VAVGRAGVLGGAARWALMLVAAAAVLGDALRFVPGATVLTLDWASVVRPVALLLVGVVYVVHDRTGRAGARLAPVDQAR